MLSAMADCAAHAFHPLAQNGVRALPCRSSAGSERARRAGVHGLQLRFGPARRRMAERTVSSVHDARVVLPRLVPRGAHLWRTLAARADRCGLRGEIRRVTGPRHRTRASIACPIFCRADLYGRPRLPTFSFVCRRASIARRPRSRGPLSVKKTFTLVRLFKWGEARPITR